MAPGPAPYAGALWFEVHDRPWNGGLGPSDPNDWQQNFGLTYSNFTPSRIRHVRGRHRQFLTRRTCGASYRHR